MLYINNALVLFDMNNVLRTDSRHRIRFERRYDLESNFFRSRELLVFRFPFGLLKFLVLGWKREVAEIGWVRLVRKVLHFQGFSGITSVERMIK